MVELDDYIINYETLVIVPLNGKKTKVYEIDDCFIVNEDCLSIVKNSCLYFGSSLEGRKVGAKSILNCEFKVPIIIEDGKSLIIFPTSSYKRNHNIWVSHSNLLDYKKNDKYTTTLVFRNNEEIDINVKYNIIDNQYIRCVKLNDFTEKRKHFLMRE